MRVQILLLMLLGSILTAKAQIYSVGNDEGFSFSYADYNPYLAIYSVGNDEGFSFSCADYNPYLAIYSVGNDEGFSFSSAGSVGNELPLPIELITFEAACNQGSVYLKWATASELNNDYFTIEKSEDGINWLAVGNIPGAGNSSQLIHYSYTDAEPINDVFYYRLKQTDFDGKHEYFKIISLTCTGNDVDILVYPNPVSSELTIAITGNTTPINFEVSDAQGSLVYKGNLTEKATVPTSSFVPGVYLIKLENEKVFEFVKVIKN